ncbi:tRNA (5-methylaminomethyl-2-thiouridylate)-methyltransferase [Magnetofaba australis]|uniref:Putative tRNA(5-methylaminomethyl-2-thiouridylate)-methyl transferase n=1 Tax=Magnetofaba australis IT-1 TaxID=1434232 RepID=A0A1Y2K8H4_9PROT|nr:tRNA (5-methylaminomethyl-2-thiouridylate)-methyltransferase [Magnetofaba australis]OSM07041.1 putative tRNA(5-methylaminomethyl-2-thiouridylate)-methyl transferase [Magnetofaba australis IT-1]
MPKARALGLLSGGLDSTLAARLLMEQGIEVACVNFYTGFCVQNHTQAIRAKEGDPAPRHDALHAAEVLGIKLHIVDISEEYVRIVTDPKYGYGKNLNPCLDCKIFMVEKAWELKEKLGFDFLFTGEVVGQRPMSQRADTMPKVARESGVEGWLVRPLCAKRLPETEPEKQGLVDREKLMGFHGRSRKPQMALAAEFGLVDYPSPAGGCCFLTDENYSRRLQDLWDNRGSKQYSMEDIILLKAGRHLRISPTCKIIVGRDEPENNFLQGFRAGRWAIRAANLPGPLALVEGAPSTEDLEAACRLTARFGKGKSHPSVAISVEHDGQTETREVAPFGADEVPQSWYL